MLHPPFLLFAVPIFPVIFVRLCPSYPPFTDSLSMSSVISWRDVCRVYVAVIYIYLYVYRSQYARASHYRIANKRRSPVAFNIACSARRDSACHERRVEFSELSILANTSASIVSSRVSLPCVGSSQPRKTSDRLFYPRGRTRSLGLSEDSPTHFLDPSNRLCIARYNRHQECFAKQSYATVKLSCPHSFAHRSLAKPSRAATVRFLRGS